MRPASDSQQHISCSFDLAEGCLLRALPPTFINVGSVDSSQLGSAALQLGVDLVPEDVDFTCEEDETHETRVQS